MSTMEQQIMMIPAPLRCAVLTEDLEPREAYIWSLDNRLRFSPQADGSLKMSVISRHSPTIELQLAPAQLAQIRSYLGAA